MFGGATGEMISMKEYAAYDPDALPDNAEHRAGCCSRAFFWVAHAPRPGSRSSTSTSHSAARSDRLAAQH